jgi:hypothetical protein
VFARRKAASAGTMTDPEPPARSCGECSKCCFVFDIPVLDKPGGAWCRHCRPGEGGCIIQDTKPDICRSFVCSWLEDVDGLGDHWKPSLCGMVVWRAKHPTDADADPVLKVHAAGDHYGAWCNEPYFTDLVNLYKIFINDGIGPYFELPVACPWSAAMLKLAAEPVEGRESTGHTRLDAG